MTRSSTSTHALRKLENTATPHARVEGKMTAIDWFNLDNAGPAGSINSCVADMAQWLRLQLADGAFEKKRVIGPGLVREMHSAQMPIRTSGMGPEGRRWDIFFTDANFPSYGLGWMVRDFRGHRCAMHGGSIDGMNSWVALLPELKLGVVVLTNFNPNLAMAGLSYRVFDRYLGAPERDWSAEFKKKQGVLEELRANFLRQQDRERVRDTKPTLALDQYAGTYRDELYGPVVVSFDKNRLTVRQGRTAIGDLNHWHYDTFRIEWRDRRTPASLATFHLNEQGEVHEVKIPSLGDLVGIRQPGSKPKP